MKSILKRALGVIAAAAIAVTGMNMLSVAAVADVNDIVISPATITFNADDANQFNNRDLYYIKLADYNVYEALGQKSVLSVSTVENVREQIAEALAIATEGSYNANTNGDPMAWVANHLNDSSAAPYAGDLRNFVTEFYRTNGSVVTKAMPEPASDTGASRTYTMLDDNSSEAPGVYLIVDKGAVNTTNATQAIPMLVGTTIKAKTGSGAKVPGQTSGTVQGYDIYAGQVDLKNELTPVTKTVNGDNAIPGVGDERTYTITGRVPNWIGKDLSNAVFTFTDTPGKGQTVDYSSIKVELVRDDDIDPGVFAPIGIDHTQYTVTQYAVDNSAESTSFVSTLVTYGSDGVSPNNMKADGQSYFVVDLTDYMKTAAVNSSQIGLDIVLTYKATINTDAVGLSNITNLVKVDNNGSTNKDDVTLPKPVSITFKKTDKDGNGLAGAQFSLKKGNDVMKVSETDGSYIVDTNGALANGSITGTIKNPLVSGNDGNVTINGLGEGTYTITETHAPDGFVEVGLPSFTITIGKDGKITNIEEDDAFGLVSFVKNNSSGNATDVTDIEVMNIKSITELPLTGAAGTVMFTVLGLLIAGIGAILYGKSRKASAAARV